MKLYPPVLLAIFVLLMGAVRFWMRDWIIIPAPYHWAGLVPALAGVALTIANGLRFKLSGTNIKPFTPPSRLITDGFYAYTRNPMYLGMALALLGLAILTGRLLSFAFPILFVLIVDRWHIRFEETAARRVFGAAYDAYTLKVRRWI